MFQINPKLMFLIKFYKLSWKETQNKHLEKRNPSISMLNQCFFRSDVQLGFVPSRCLGGSFFSSVSDSLRSSGAYYAIDHPFVVSCMIHIFITHIFIINTFITDMPNRGFHQNFSHFPLKQFSVHNEDIKVNKSRQLHFSNVLSFQNYLAGNLQFYKP